MDLKVISGVDALPEKKILKFTAIDKTFELEFEAKIALDGIAFFYNQIMDNILGIGPEKFKVPIRETLVAIKKKVPLVKWLFHSTYRKSYEERKVIARLECDKKLEEFKTNMLRMREEEIRWNNPKA